MGFDSFLDGFKKEQDAPNKLSPQITETLEWGAKLIDVDYLPQLLKLKKLQKYMVGYKEMNLYKRGWRFQIGMSKEWAGLCSPSGQSPGKSKAGKNIFISLQIAKHDLNWQKNMKGVILHEIAHAIVLEIFELDKKNMGKLHLLDDLDKVSKGHGVVWKMVCKKISGGECRIQLETAVMADSFKNYKFDCGGCGVISYGNNPRFTDVCPKCGTFGMVTRNAD